LGGPVIDHEWQTKELQIEFGKRMLSALILFKRNSTTRLSIVTEQTLSFRPFKKLMIYGAVLLKNLLDRIIWICEGIENGHKMATISLIF
jgi:hypothetical protein